MLLFEYFAMGGILFFWIKSAGFSNDGIDNGENSGLQVVRCCFYFYLFFYLDVKEPKDQEPKTFYATH